jgi:hypothetical protein
MPAQLCICHVWLRADRRELDGARHQCIGPVWDASGWPANGAAAVVEHRKMLAPEGLPVSDTTVWRQLSMEALLRADPSGALQAKLAEVRHAFEAILAEQQHPHRRRTSA